jgi:subtilase family serine protease
MHATRTFRRRAQRTGVVGAGLLACGTLLAAMAGPAAASSSLPATTAAALAASEQIPGYAPLWAYLQSQGGTATADLGPAAASAPVDLRVYLAGRDPGGLAAYAAAVSDPRSPLYRHYLSSAQVRHRFGATAAQVGSVKAWLAGAGLTVQTVTPHYVAATGDAASAQRAFGAPWYSYQIEGTTQQSFTPSAQLSAPGTVAAAVLTVAPVPAGQPAPSPTPSASPTPRPSPTPSASPTPSPSPAPGAPACSSYFGQSLATTLPAAYGRTVPYLGCGYTPQQLRSAYGVPAGLTGKGVTVAIVGVSEDPSAARGVAKFGARHGQPWRPGQYRQILQPGLAVSCQEVPDVHSEQAADAETVHDMAPAANVVAVLAQCGLGAGERVFNAFTDASDLPVLDALTQITDQHLASIVTSSPTIRVSEATTSPGLVAAYEQVFQQGAAEGIGFYFAAGDYGDNSLVTQDHQPESGYPLSDPWVTSVGGTSLAVGSAGQYEWEAGWGDHTTGLTANGTTWQDPPGSFSGGSGGGTSTLFAQPSYQRGVVPPALSHAHGTAAAMRVFPDIAADADPYTGVLVGGFSSPGPGQPAIYGESPAGGNSLSVQLIGGMQADAQQAAGAPIGFANPAIYARYTPPSAWRHGDGAYHDVTGAPLGPGVTPAVALPAQASINGVPGPYLVTLGLDQGLAAAPGYDDITGVGTPAAGYFGSYRR